MAASTLVPRNFNHNVCAIADDIFRFVTPDFISVRDCGHFSYLVLSKSAVWNPNLCTAVSRSLLGNKTLITMRAFRTIEITSFTF